MNGHEAFIRYCQQAFAARLERGFDEETWDYIVYMLREDFQGIVASLEEMRAAEEARATAERVATEIADATRLPSGKKTQFRRAFSGYEVWCYRRYIRDMPRFARAIANAPTVRELAEIGAKEKPYKARISKRHMVALSVAAKIRHDKLEHGIDWEFRVKV